ncbi:hypothetical protein WJX84_002354 [Apatococcus fuscideae]|uniref:phosphoethanolamine N-methyltransferase n=1 Tax=Apatococcus fuscideae TaxID=2026836 RepID=A0AAW1SIQ5_9CHLO
MGRRLPGSLNILQGMKAVPVAQEGHTSLARCSGSPFGKRKAGFVDVKAEDQTHLFGQCLQRELAAAEQDREGFVQDLSQEDYNTIMGGGREKLQRVQAGEQRWGLYVLASPASCRPYPSKASLFYRISSPHSSLQQKATNMPASTDAADGGSLQRDFQQLEGLSSFPFSLYAALNPLRIVPGEFDRPRWTREILFISHHPEEQADGRWKTAHVDQEPLYLVLRQGCRPLPSYRSLPGSQAVPL